MPLIGGLSPDGKWRIRVIGDNPSAGNYAFGFFERSEKSPLFQVNFGSSFCTVRDASSIDRALWNKEGTLVAIEDRDTRHSMAMHLLVITDGKSIKVSLPPFGKAMVEKTVNIHGGGPGACGCKPLRWIGQAITFRFYAGAYISDVTMRVMPSNPPRAILVSETPPKEGNLLD